MAERWYVIPTEITGRPYDDDALEPIIELFSPASRRVWPEARALPRRVVGRTRKA
jgi:hypothetical protein